MQYVYTISNILAVKLIEKFYIYSALKYVFPKFKWHSFLCSAMINLCTY